MYEAYYGMAEAPFSVTPDPRFLFLSPAHQEALQHLRYGIEKRKGFIVLVGEVGCGKTTLCRRMLDEIDELGTCDTALIVNPRLTETQLVRAILAELGEKASGRGLNELMENLQEVLFERIAEGRDIVLVVDEAQNMPIATLEHLRLLSNLETDTQKLLQIILIGQPELKKRLSDHRIRQLRQRILVYAEIKPFTQIQTMQYIQHRMTAVGAETRPSFTNWAMRKIHKHARGTPRIINHLCDRALMAAYIRESDVVKRADVAVAVKEEKALA